MPTVDVAPASYEAASALLGRQVAPALDDIVGRLTGTLSQTGGMAGSDPAGRAWAGSYDAATRSVVSGMQTQTSAAFRLAGLLEQTGFNHRCAELASRAGADVSVDRTRYDLMFPGCASTVPTAAGGTGGGPPGWSLVQKYLAGYVWPNGHQDRLRAAAGAWRQASAEMGKLPEATLQAQYSIDQQVSPDAGTAVEVCAAYGGHLDEVASMCQTLADACDAMAGHLDQAHSQIEHELAWGTAETIGITAITFGFGAVFGVSEGRIAAAAARIGDIIAQLIAKAEALAGSMSGIVTRAVAVVQRLKPLSEADTVAAEVENAQQLPEIGSTAEEIADQNLELAAEKEAADAKAWSELPTAARRSEKPPGFDPETWQWRSASRNKVGMDWWDPEGGEWRYHPADKYHAPHWDYNPWTQWNTRWQHLYPGD